MEFELTNFARFTTLGIFEEIRKMMTDNANLSSSKVGSSSCQCTACWSFLGPGSEKTWYGTCSDKTDGDWDRTAERMMLNFAESGHPKSSWHKRPGKRRIKKLRKG